MSDKPEKHPLSDKTIVNHLGVDKETSPVEDEINFPEFDPAEFAPATEREEETTTRGQSEKVPKAGFLILLPSALCLLFCCA